MPTPFSRKNVVTSFILLAAGLLAAWYWQQFIHPFESTDNAYLKAHISLVSPKETGYVKAVLFEDNQVVKPGDVLVIIDDHNYRTHVAQAEAQLQLELAHIQTLEADKLTQQAKIHQEAANLAAAKIDSEHTAKEFKRFSNLDKEGAISTQILDKAQSVYQQALAHRDQSSSALEQAQSQYAALDAQIEEAKARSQAAEAALELAKIDLANTRVTAPITGIIGNRSVQVGQLVKPGSALGYLVPADGLFIEANFKETQMATMQPGQTVEIHIDAYPDADFEGVVDSFAPASGAEFSLLPSENATGNFTKIVRRVPVKILFKAGTDLSQLRPGLSTVVKVRVR